jgi:hypothetical protein
MTKDRDFLHLLFEQGPPPQVIWLRVGNSSNQALQAVLLRTLKEAVASLREGERPMAWGNLCGGSSGRSWRLGYQAVAWQCSGVGGLRGEAGCSDQIFAFSIRMRTSLAEMIPIFR